MHSIGLQQARALLHTYWACDGEMTALNSYADRNFKVSNADGDFVLKIANPQWQRSDLEFENAALRHLAKHRPQLPCPRLISSLDGQDLIALPLQDDLLCHVRLLTFVAGQVYGDYVQQHPQSQAALQTSLGSALAQLDLGLSEFQHPSMYRHVDWNLSELIHVSDEVKHIDNPTLAAVVRRHSDYFLVQQAHWRTQLPMSIIHNDANDYNIIVTENAVSKLPQVHAFIDFGDMCFQFRVLDLAIAIVYALQTIDNLDEVSAAITRIVAGYQTHIALQPEEMAALYPLIMARLCQSCLMATRAIRQQPENDYILISQKGVRRLLLQLDSLTPAEITTLFHS